MTEMRIKNRTRNTLLGSRVELVASWWGRLWGFIGRQKPLPGEGILLLPCDAVHTYGMRFALDILFLDQNGKILEVVPRLQPWKRTSRIPGAHYVLELPEGMIEQTGTRVGDRLSWWEPAPMPISERISGKRYGGSDRSTPAVHERESN